MKLFSKIIKSKLMINIVAVVTIVGMIGGYNIVFDKSILVKASENVSTDELKIKEVSVGTNHNIIIRSDGTVWGAGYNGYGQLGLGNTTSQISEVKIPIDNVKEVTCGYNDTIFIKNDGTVWGTGDNGDGQLGLGNTTSPSTPVQLPIDNIKRVSFGESHIIFLKNDGTVWGCGFNGYGQLGIGNTTSQLSLVQIPIEDVNDIECGHYDTKFLKNDGTVWATGYNGYGQLGIGNAVNQSSPVKASIDGVKEISSGYYHTMFLKNDGTVWCVGENGYGQLVIGNLGSQSSPVKASIDDVKEINCGNSNTMFLKNDGTVWSAGYNYYGQLGIGNTTSQSSPVKVPVNNIKNVISAGMNTYFIGNDDSVFGCGYNGNGELGVGHTSNIYLPIRMESYWIYRASHALNKIYNNLSIINEYGSLASRIYGNSDFEDNKPVSYTTDSATLANIVVNDPQLRMKEVLPNGSAITVDNYGLVQYYPTLTSAAITLATDGTTIDKIEYGMLNQSPVINFYMKDGSIWYYDLSSTVLTLKVLPITQSNLTKTTVYKDKSAKALFFLFQKINGDLVYYNLNRIEVSTGININNVIETIPSTLNNSTLYLMKDGTLKYLNASGIATNITLPSGLSIEDILSNRFIKMSNGFIYAINNNAIVATNILESTIKTAVNNILWFKNGTIQTLSNTGALAALTVVNGDLIKSIVPYDNNNAYILNIDNTTYGIGNLINGTDLKARNIDYDNIAAFISNNDASATGKLLIMKDGSVYYSPSSWTRSNQIAFNGVVLDELQGEREALLKATNAVSKAELSKLQEDVDAARVLVNALDDDINKTNLLNRLNVVQNYINNLPKTPTSTKININQIDKSSVTISWQDSNPKQTKYQIKVGTKYVTSSGALTVIPTWFTCNEKKITITGLDPSTSYDISVKGRNQAGIICYQSQTIIVTTLN